MEETTKRVAELFGKMLIADVTSVGGSKNFNKQPTKLQIQKYEQVRPREVLPTDEWIDEWIERHESFIDFQNTCRGSSIKPIVPFSQIQKQSVDLKVSLQMFLQEATTSANIWKDVKMKFGDRRSFPTFLWLLQMQGLDWHKYSDYYEDKDINVRNQPNRCSASLQIQTGLTSTSDLADEYYSRNLSLVRLLQNIQLKSSDDFSQEQARMLEPFLGHLIMIQQEQRVVVYSFSQHLEQLRNAASSYRFSEHLEQLRNSGAASSLASSSYAVGDRGKCPSILSEHNMEYFMWQQKHLFDSLYIISRESAWLLKKFKDSGFASPSFIKDSEKIAETVEPFILTFKKSKESLDHVLHNFVGWHLIEDESLLLVMRNNKILDDFSNNIKGLQNEGVGRGSVTETLLGCLGDVCKISLDDYGEKTRSSALYVEYKMVAQETMELIEEARKKLCSLRFSTLSGGSPLGNITLWRILFESSVASLRLDLISKKHDEATKLGVRLLVEAEHPNTFVFFVHKYLDQLRTEISLLLLDGDKVLLDFVAMHKTVAEITCILGDAFTTGGAGMNDLRDETASPGSPSKSYEEMEMDIIRDFPWDKHTVPPESKFDSEADYCIGDCFGPDSDYEDLIIGDCFGPDSDNGDLIIGDCFGPDSDYEDPIIGDCFGPYSDNGDLIIGDCFGPDSDYEDLIIGDCFGPYSDNADLIT